MRNRLFLLLLMPLLANCHSAEKKQNDKIKTTCHENKVHVEKIVLHRVSLWSIFTIIDVSCDDFNHWFSKTMKKDTITDPDQIAVFRSYINNLQKIDSGIYSIDTRAKIYLMSSKDTTEYCMDNFLIFSNGTFYKAPKDFLEYIEYFEENDEKM